MAGQLPVLQQFCLVKSSPFKHQALGYRRQSAVHNDRVNLNRGFVFAIDGVKVRLAMFAVKHADDDAEEAGDFRHVVTWLADQIDACGASWAATGGRSSGSIVRVG